MTYTLIATNVAMFIVEVACGASPISPTPQQILELGGGFAPLTLHGEWWRLGSSMFLHFGILHLGLNMVCLYQARVVERLFGPVGFLVIYLVAGLGGGIASLLTSAGNAVAAGASGAVFGVYGAFGAFLLLRRSELEVAVWQRIARSLASFLGVNLVIGLSLSGVSLSAHVGGLLVGLAGGAALLAGAGAAQQRTARALGLAATGIVLTAVAVMSITAEPDVPPVLRTFDAVEQASNTLLSEAFGRAKAGALTVPAFGEIVERDVLPRYKAMRQDVLATKDVPLRLRPLFEQIDQYTAARVAAWEKFLEAVREPDENKRKSLFDAYQRQEEVVAERRNAIQRLPP